MTRTALIWLATGGSAALLLGAWGFQLLGYAPCQMCVWQRWPHGAAVILGILATAAPLAILPLLGALAALSTAGIGVFHTGVERGWWEGVTACASGDIGGLSVDDLMTQIMEAPLVRCDEVAWQFLTLSMASWNALISAGLALVWLAAWRRTRG